MIYCPALPLLATNPGDATGQNQISQWAVCVFTQTNSMYSLGCTSLLYFLPGCVNLQAMEFASIYWIYWIYWQVYTGR